MATTAYETALHAIEQLTSEERQRRRSDLADGSSSGAAFVDALLGGYVLPLLIDNSGRA
jgi:hypothetical protein